jgi:anti-anti-sigma factor
LAVHLHEAPQPYSPRVEVPPFRISMDVWRGRVTVAGELDRAQARQLVDAVAMLADAGHRSITVDTELVTFCDLAGLRALLVGHALAARRGCELTLAETSPCLRRLLTIVGMDTELGSCSSARSALASVHRANVG